MVIVLMLDRYLKGLILLFYVLKGFMSDEISQESDSSVYLLEGLMLDRDLKSVILVFMCSKAWFNSYGWVWSPFWWFIGQQHILICWWEQRSWEWQWKWCTMHQLWMLWELVVCSFTGLGRQFPYLFSQRHGDLLASMTKSRQITQLDCTLCVYWVMYLLLTGHKFIVESFSETSLFHLRNFVPAPHILELCMLANLWMNWSFLGRAVSLQGSGFLFR